MKYIRLGLTPTTRAIHPLDQTIADMTEVTRESILHVDARGDEMTILYRLTGDREPLAELLAAREEVSDYELVDDDDGFTAYIRATAEEPGSELIAIAHEYALIIDTPIEITEDGLAVTLVGTHDALRQALGAVPDDITTTILNAGPYTPSSDGLLDHLTDRQREVFRTAVDQGYYDLPRRATHEQLASELDCAPSTVDEHLRKAESRVVAGLLG